MLRIIAVLLALVLALPSLAKADPDEELKVDLCREAMSRMLCKGVDNFQYIGMRGPRTYVFNVFYASKNSNFLCTVTDDMLLVTTPVWLRAERSVFYHMDDYTHCATGEFHNPECGIPRKFKVCRKASSQELKNRKDDDFWGKSVPGNLPDPPEESEANGTDAVKDSGNAQ